MIKTIKKIVVSSRVLTSLFNLFSKLYAYSTPKEIERRKKLDIFDYKQISKPLRYYPFFTIKDNTLYGNGRVLFKYLNIPKKYYGKYLIEHGLILGDLVQKHNFYSFCSNIITYSSYRKKFLESTSKTINCVGPYIKYSSYIMEEEDMAEYKKKLGKTLLYFPSHSTGQLASDFDVKEVIEEIEKVEYKYDTILVCLYWKDIQLGRDKYYIEKGYKVVTAGHIYDIYFLDRLKTIIALSDYTMSNDVGTHVGYCICLDKPHLISKIEVKYKFIKKDKSDYVQRNSQEVYSLNKAKEHIMSVFSIERESITFEQIECIKKYWGDF